MDKKLRISIIVISLLLILAMLAGCGERAATSSPPAPSSDPTEVVSEPTEEPDAEPTEEPAYFPLVETRTLSYWMSFPPIFADYAEGPNEYLVYTEAEKRLNVELEWVTANFMAARETFNIMVSTGEYTDMIAGYQNYSSIGLEQSVSDGIIIDLTELIDKYAPDYAAARMQNDMTAKTTISDDGRLLQFYYLYTMEGMVNDKGPIVRQDWLDESGVEALVTMDDYEKFLTYTSEKYGAGLALPCQGTWNTSCFEGAFDIVLPFGNLERGLFQTDGEVKFGGSEQGFRDYLTLMNKWYAAGLIEDGFESDTASQTSGYPSTDNIASGKVSVFFGVSKEIPTYEQMCEAELTPIAYPRLTADQIRHVAPSLGGANSSAAVSISSDCEDTELAVRFMNWFFTDEGFILTNYGVEGMTFDYVDGKPVFTDLVVNNPEGMSLNIALTLYTGGTSGVPMLFDNTKYEQIYNEKQYQAGYIWIENEDRAYSLGSTALNTEESEAVSSVWQDIQTIFFENCLKFITGSRSLDEFDDFVKTMYDQGLQDVLDAYTTAYARWAAK